MSEILFKSACPAAGCTDDETYYFSNLDCINLNETFNEGDNVLFIPVFGEMDSASKVEKVSSNE